MIAMGQSPTKHQQGKLDKCEPRKAEVNWTATEVMVNAIEAVKVNEPAWSSLLSVGSRVIVKGDELRKDEAEVEVTVVARAEPRNAVAGAEPRKA